MWGGEKQRERCDLLRGGEGGGGGGGKTSIL